MKKVKLNYMSAVEKTEPVARVKVSSAKMAELDESIRMKIKQNESEYNRARDKNCFDSFYYY